MECMAKRLRKRYSCPTEFTLAVLEGKWKSALLCCLAKHPCRYGELRRLMPGVSDKMLSSRVRSLLEQGLVVRQNASGRPPVQTYSLSALGYTLSEVLTGLSSWASEHAAAFGVQLGTCPRESPAASDSSPRTDSEAGGSCRTRLQSRMRTATLTYRCVDGRLKWPSHWR
jgi:DNA-binding HxlR family transcriptional regulator